MQMAQQKNINTNEKNFNTQNEGNFPMQCSVTCHTVFIWTKQWKCIIIKNARNCGQHKIAYISNTIQ